MRIRPLLVFVLAAACDGGSTSPLDSDLEVTPTELSFPRTFVGTPTTAVLTLRNKGLAPRTVTLSTGNPFVIDPPEHRLGANALARVTIRFEPVIAGAHRAAVEVRAGDGSASVQLTGLAELPPECGPAPECQSSAFDPVQARCVSSDVPDGAACESRCLDNPRCVAGACAGNTRSCDDANRCTNDACDPSAGCVHVDATARLCPPPTRPCRVPTCSPTSGCGEEEAPDGTPCGAIDCRVANVCFSGHCMALTVPEGSPCNPGGLCPGPAECRQGACVETAPGTLRELWRYDRLRGYPSEFAADGADNLYWTEWVDESLSPTPSELVSYTSDGVPRFRIPLRNRPYWPYQPRLAQPMVEDDTVLVFGEEGWLTELDARTGHELSSENLLTALGLPIRLPGTTDGFILLQAHSNGPLLFFIAWNPGNLWREGPGVLAAWSRSSRAILWRRDEVATFPRHLVGDHELLFLTAESSDGSSIAALSHDGQVRWTAFPQSPCVVEFVGDNIVPCVNETGIQMLNREDGGLAAFAAVPIRRSDRLRSAPGHHIWGISDVGEEPSYRVDVVLIDAITGTPARRPLYPENDWRWMSPPVVTNIGSMLLFATPDPNGPLGPTEWDLVEVTRTLEERRCRVPGAVDGDPKAILLDERLVMLNVDSGPRIFHLPHRRLASSGWVTAAGAPGRTFRARR